MQTVAEGAIAKRGLKQAGFSGKNTVGGYGKTSVDKFVVPMQLPGLNEIIDAAKSHWSVYRKMKQTYQEAVAWSAKQIQPFERAFLDIAWYEPNMKRDTDNIAAGKKFLLDGLQTAGKVENDGWKQIAGFSDTFAVDKRNPRVEVEIRRL